MSKVLSCLATSSLLFVSVHATSAYAQGFEAVECVSFSKGRMKPNSRWLETRGGVTYSCYCDPQRGTVCSQQGKSGNAPVLAPGGNLSPAQQVAVGLMGTLFQGLFSNMAGDGQEAEQAEEAAREHEELRKKQEAKKKALDQWMETQARAEARRLADEAARRKKGEDILAKSSVGAVGLKADSIGGGLSPFTVVGQVPLSGTAPIGINRLTETERLLCSAYFSRLAEDAARNGDMERVLFYGAQMDNALQGLPASIECTPPKDLTVFPGRERAGALDKKLAAMSALYREMAPKIERLQEIETGLVEARRTRKEAEQKIKEMDERIEQMRTRPQTGGEKDEKAGEDGLLAEALALKSEAEKQRQEAIESEEGLTRERNGIERELDAIKDRTGRR